MDWQCAMFSGPTPWVFTECDTVARGSIAIQHRRTIALQIIRQPNGCRWEYVVSFGNNCGGVSSRAYTLSGYTSGRVLAGVVAERPCRTMDSSSYVWWVHAVIVFEEQVAQSGRCVHDNPWNVQLDGDIATL